MSSLSPALRCRVSELSAETGVYHTERLINVIKFFDLVDAVQLECAFHYSDVVSIGWLIGPSCPLPTLRMMHTLLMFLIHRHTTASSQSYRW